MQECSEALPSIVAHLDGRTLAALASTCTAGPYTPSHAAQLELTLPLSAQLKPGLSHIRPTFPRGCVPKVLKLSSNVSDVCRMS